MTTETIETRRFTPPPWADVGHLPWTLPDLPPIYQTRLGNLVTHALVRQGGSVRRAGLHAALEGVEQVLEEHDDGIPRLCHRVFEVAVLILGSRNPHRLSPRTVNEIIVDSATARLPQHEHKHLGLITSARVLSIDPLTHLGGAYRYRVRVRVELLSRTT